MLTDAISDSGNLKKQNRAMNLIIWLVCVMVVYNIFYNRFFDKKRDFINLKKIGFQSLDLLKIIGMEFLVLAFTGFLSGIITGFLLNKIIYIEIMKPLVSYYKATDFVSSGLSIYSIKNTVIMLLFVLIPSVITAMLQLRTATPLAVMSNKRKNTRKVILSLIILALSTVLISWLGIQDNESDSGITYVHTYVPGDLQISIGSLSEGVLREAVPTISDNALYDLDKNPDIKQIQSYEVNYDMDIFLCEEKSKLNKEVAGYYEMLTSMEQKIDGKKQCLCNIILAATDNIKALVPSYNQNKKEHTVIMQDGLAQALNLKVGDTFSLYSGEIMTAGSKENVTNVTVKLIDTREDMVLSESHIGPNLIIVDKETAKLFPGKLSRQIINIWAKDGKETTITSSLNQMPEFDGCFIHSARQEIQEYADLDRNQMTIHYFFIILLALIGILTYFNTVFINTLSRMKEFIIMYKIGIRKMEMYLMVTKEGIRNGITALVIIGIAQVILCIYRKIVFGKIFFITDIAVIILCILFPVVAVLYLFKFSDMTKYQLK